MKTLLVIVDSDKCRSLLAEPERFCSEGRLLQCAKTANERVRIQGYAAELALSYALSGEALLPPVYRNEANGKPVIDSGFISLSHSGRFAVCAYSPVPVGVDIEENRIIRPAIAKRLLSDIEAAQYAVSDDEFFLLKKFVMKEAYLKLTGEGITGGLREIEEHSGTVLRSGVPSAFYLPFEDDAYSGAIVMLEKTELEKVVLY